MEPFGQDLARHTLHSQSLGFRLQPSSPLYPAGTHRILDEPAHCPNHCSGIQFGRLLARSRQPKLESVDPHFGFAASSADRLVDELGKALP